MAATQLQASCPDPHAPAPSDDPELVALEERVAGALTAAVGRDLHSTTAPAAIRAYVARLRGLDCPPEAVVVHIKRLLSRVEPAASASAARRRAFYELREAAILYCIQEYFAHSGAG
ncbi:MAG TPA: hypothetical protein VHM30_07850 [Gemmatimonadaceae bacterium]|nr:hypothetical protein [Gemmatimonadaceae bacterium]